MSTKGNAMTSAASGAAADVPHKRAHFKELLLADHFKELPSPSAGSPPEGDTAYEQLVCVGYQPQLAQLNAVVHLKLSNGYAGDICTSGSTEYVKFFSSSRRRRDLDRTGSHLVHRLGCQRPETARVRRHAPGGSRQDVL